MTWILGVNVPPVGWHDTAACLIDETGQIYGLAEEERFTRLKHGLHQQPSQAVAFCLAEAGIEPSDIDIVAVGWDAPRLYASHGMPWRYASPDQILEGIGISCGRPEVVMVPHHRAHAYCAWYASGLADTAIVVVDGNGEDESISIFEARDGRPLVRRRRWPRPNSLGLMYAAVSETLRFGLLGSGKTMGLASFGRATRLEPWPMLDESLNPAIGLGPDSSYDDVMEGWRKHIGALFDPADIHNDLNQLATNDAAIRLAWSAQHAIEQAMTMLVDLARRTTGIDDVCLSGGVALNCSANGRLPGPVHAAPVPHDGGVALGAAWSLCTKRPSQPMSPFLGARISGPQNEGQPFELAKVVELLEAGKVGAIADGRAEAGPRALGHRSIIAIPRSADVRDDINRRKGREPWRPLAPVALAGSASNYWTPIPQLQRYMLGASEATAEGREAIPGAVHIDGTVRAQMLEDDEGVLGQILTAMAESGIPPVLINTSLNTRGEPLVNTSAQAIAAAVAIGLDFIIIGDRLVVRA